MKLFFRLTKARLTQEDSKSDVLFAHMFGLSHLILKIKMAETSDVYGLVRAGGNYFINKRSVKVVLGGCGN